MRVKDDPLYETWCTMKRRCTDQRHISYQHYGARGISVCDRWLIFANFKADMGERPPGFTLDRKDSSGNYEPENCRWATVSEQNRNKRDTIPVEINGVTKPVGVWARERGMSPQVIHYRMRKLGWSAIQALTVPLLRNRAPA